MGFNPFSKESHFFLVFPRQKKKEEKNGRKGKEGEKGKMPKN